MNSYQGETDLGKILRSMQVTIHEGQYVFCSLPSGLDGIDLREVKSCIVEREGMSVVVPRRYADEVLHITYDFVASWITIDVHSSLSAVGLTAVIAKALSREKISCNVIAGFYHDHVFVSHVDCERAITILQSLSV